MLPLFVLLWKHFIVRKRRYINTPLEMISTIFGILFVFLLKGYFYSINDLDFDEKSSMRSLETQWTRLRTRKDDLDYSMDSISSPSLIYYTPVTDATRSLMLRVGEKLGLSELNHVPDENDDESGIYGVHNVSHNIQVYTAKMGDFDAFVIFETPTVESQRSLVYHCQQNETKAPQPSLNYTIKLKSDFSYLQNGSILGHLLYEPFLRLQWVIDTTFLESLPGSPGVARTKNLTFHEVKSVKKPKNFGVLIMIFFLLLMNSFALMLPFVFLMTRYIEEKVSGHLEMLKMNGVSMLTSMVAHLLNMLPTGLFYALVTAMLMKITSTPIVPVTSFCFLFWVHLINFYSIMLWALLCSFVVNKPNYSTAISSLMFFAFGVPGFIVNAISNKPEFVVKLVGLIFPKAAMDSFFFELAILEADGTGITLSNMWTSHSEGTLSYFGVCLSLVLQMVILGQLVLWLHKVRPGPYGTPEPCSSGIPFCRKKKKPEEQELENLEQETPRDPKYFEDPPGNKKVGIKIINVSKVFGEGANRFQALSNVTFDIYRGEIMVLLGHNGAGKTTLLSILTGMIPSSGGKIFVSGHDIESAQSKVRKEIGYCTQHDMFIPYLTILEQVRFFAMLKGQTFKEAQKTSVELLGELNISDRAHYKSHQLSGGMKRRLQLACALAGGSTVLVLDEPTSGLDVETRRELWDLLLELRGTRTMVLTTHYMEEADALGDRVAALHQGTLRCHATPMHLKKNIGSGYRLTLMTRGPPNEAEITQVVTSSVPGAFLKDKGTNQVTYDLPAGNTAQFPALFENLEGQQDKLEIESIGVSMPTLEEVFLRLCSNVETNISDDKQLAGMHMAEYKKLTGSALFKRQAIVLIKRHYYYMLESKWSVLIWQVILPVCLIFVMTYMYYSENKHPEKKEGDKKVLREGGENTDRAKNFRRIFNPTVVFHAKNRGAVEPMADSLKDIRFTEVSDDDQDEIKQKGQMQLYRKDKYLAGILMNNSLVKITFKTGMYDVASIALNILSNIMAAEQLGGSRRTIHTRQQPIVTARFGGQTRPESGPGRQGMLQIPTPVKLPDANRVSLMIRYVAVLFFVMMGNASSMASRERLTGTRNIYIMSGCSVPVFWISRLLFFFVFYFVVLLVPLVIALVAFPSSRVIWTFEPLAVLVMIFCCGCCSWLCFVFLIGLFASERITSAVCLGFTFVLIIFIVGIGAEAETSPKAFEQIAIVLPILKGAILIGTPGSFGMAMDKTSQVALANAYCDLNRHLCPLLFPTRPPFDYEKCCIKKERAAEYFNFRLFSPLPYILLMLVHFAIYLLFLILIEKGWFQNKCKRSYNQPPPQFNDRMVQAEKAYVNETFKLPKNQIQDVMLVNNLHKKFCCKDKPAVRGISFSIKQGECFGVLGVNGAGKSTTFKMIVGEIAASHGATFANSHFLVSERLAYLRSLSYCPQFLGLDTYMTGYQNVRTLLTIRGLEEQDVQKEAELCFDVVGLQIYKHKKVAEYSGGCLRRLAAGTALSSGAAVTLLDEPTCGVDVTARRRVWANIQQSLQQKRAVIITSHSMDEMETLSNRLAILARGEVRALGSPGALRATHSAGHAVVLKLVSTAPADGSIAALKAEVQRKFNCTLKDEHSTMLRYHINENMKNSQLFKELEILKADFGTLIEDYSVSATTLEEVFLAIAKETSAEAEKKRNEDMRKQQEMKGRKDTQGQKEPKDKKRRREFKTHCYRNAEV